MLKFGAGATVADLRYRIDAEAASTGPYEIRAGLPAADWGRRRDARGRGPVPTAVVVLQKAKRLRAWLSRSGVARAASFLLARRASARWPYESRCRGP